jgi:hypothetical protein
MQLIRARTSAAALCAASTLSDVGQAARRVTACCQKQKYSLETASRQRSQHALRGPTDCPETYIKELFRPNHCHCYKQRSHKRHIQCLDTEIRDSISSFLFASFRRLVVFARHLARRTTYERRLRVCINVLRDVVRVEDVYV